MKAPRVRARLEQELRRVRGPVQPHRKCSCVVYAYANFSGRLAAQKLGELTDMESIGSNAEGSETLHLRLAGLDTGTNHFLHVVVVHQLSVKYRKH
jgi:hypothetical protein